MREQRLAAFTQAAATDQPIASSGYALCYRPADTQAMLEHCRKHNKPNKVFHWALDNNGNIICYTSKYALDDEDGAKEYLQYLAAGKDYISTEVREWRHVRDHLCQPRNQDKWPEWGCVEKMKLALEQEKRAEKIEQLLVREIALNITKA